MSFRGRLVAATSALTALTLGLAFAAVYSAVNRDQELQLDTALLDEAMRDASEVGREGWGPLSVEDGPGPTANDVGPLTKYELLVGKDGRIRSTTATFHGVLPPSSVFGHADGRPFDVFLGDEHLRALLVPVPRHDDLRLLLAAPRTDLDGDANFIGRAMVGVFVLALGWSAALTFAVVRRLTREHQAVADVALRVAAGDLTARVRIRSKDREIDRLAQNVDEMVERIGSLMSAQQLFLAQAAHELRSPIAALHGRLALALRKPRDVEEYRHAITEALDSARALTALTEDLLKLASLAGQASSERTPVPALAVVRSARDAIADDAAGRGVRVSLSGDEASTVVGRALDLERMLRNLLENAVRHCAAGGHVDVTVRESGGRVTIEVLDDGPGVPESDRARIFEPFFRGAEERTREDGGAGLGLAIARDIARRHGGDLSLEPSSGTGAAFLVALPAPPRDVARYSGSP